MSLILVDCEGIDVIAGTMTEFGAVDFDSFQRGAPLTFHGDLRERWPLGKHGHREVYEDTAVRVFQAFDDWLSQLKGRPIFVSDNPAYDWQGINYGFLKFLGANPFGHSARRISDFYAGLVGNFYKTQEWKKFRVTPHDHNPVHDALGNCEALRAIMYGER